MEGKLAAAEAQAERRRQRKPSTPPLRAVPADAVSMLRVDHGAGPSKPLAEPRGTSHHSTSTARHEQEHAPAAAEKRSTPSQGQSAGDYIARWEAYVQMLQGSTPLSDLQDARRQALCWLQEARAARPRDIRTVAKIDQLAGRLGWKILEALLGDGGDGCGGAPAAEGQEQQQHMAPPPAQQRQGAQQQRHKPPLPPQHAQQQQHRHVQQQRQRALQRQQQEVEEVGKENNRGGKVAAGRRDTPVHPLGSGAAKNNASIARMS